MTAAEVLPQPLLHQPRSAGSAVRKSQLCRCPRLFVSAQASYFGASSQERHPRRAERRRAHTLHLTGSRGVEFMDACDPRRCPSETDCTFTLNEEISSKQRDSLGVNDALNQILKIETRYSEQPGTSCS